MMMALGTTLLLGSARAALAAQEQMPMRVELTTTESHTVWYTDPMWLALGAVVVLLLIVLAIMASRSGEGKSTTTVIR
jgi:hypothetical protein